MSKVSIHFAFTAILMAVLVVMAVLLMTGQIQFRTSTPNEAPVRSSGLMKTEAEFRNKLAELRMQRDKVQRGIKRLEKLKSETVDHLKSKGIESGQDYLDSEDPDVKYAVINLRGWVGQIAKIQQQVTHYDDAIRNIEVMLDKLERERIDQSVALSEAESMELQKIIIDLDERLEVDTDFLEQEQLQKLLDQEMGKQDE